MLLQCKKMSVVLKIGCIGTNYRECAPWKGLVKRKCVEGYGAHGRGISVL